MDKNKKIGILYIIGLIALIIIVLSIVTYDKSKTCNTKIIPLNYYPPNQFIVSSECNIKEIIIEEKYTTEKNDNATHEIWKITTNLTKGQHNIKVITNVNNKTFIFESKIKECDNGETKKCTIDKCQGEQICQNNKWQDCEINKICEPGEEKPCAINPCTVGHKICNECGTDYGPCR